MKTNSCEAPHTGYIVSGRIKVVMDDGSEIEGGPSDAAYNTVRTQCMGCWGRTLCHDRISLEQRITQNPMDRSNHQFFLNFDSCRLSWIKISGKNTIETPIFWTFNELLDPFRSESSSRFSLRLTPVGDRS